MSQIALDGELISLKSCKVALSMQLAEQDMSGQSSSTASSEQGDKAKELKVTGLIPFTDKWQLSRLFELATAKDEAGNRLVRRIGSGLSRAVKIRQVKFFGQISAPEHPTLLAWNVSFQLREYLSIPEVAEQRQPQTDASTGQSTEQTASVIPTAAITEAPPKVKVSSMEKILSGIDSIIGDPA
ncbi:hypothetical protein [Shewanella sp. GutDb-MelDb]|uniref:baseplate complex protein n=1 Tax=Shewanella sp. GutDb-MelDb TaxID=2058316 RepID=UPI000C7CD696|nr:hypothetical protein [Shewanella sp. GutDb-MelDb]PKG57747.1 hypothetical protein CXF82_08210 [Shewanella sp. GutDb-MelDb]